MKYGYIKGTAQEDVLKFENYGVLKENLYADEKGEYIKYRELKEKLKRGDILLIYNFNAIANSVNELKEEILSLKKLGVRLIETKDGYDSEGLFSDIFEKCLKILSQLGVEDAVKKQKLAETQERINREIEIIKQEIKNIKDTDETVNSSDKTTASVEEDYIEGDVAGDDEDNVLEPEIISESTAKAIRELEDIREEDEIAAKEELLNNKKYQLEEDDKFNEGYILDTGEDVEVAETKSTVKHKMPPKTYEVSEIPKEWENEIQKDSKLQASIKDLMKMATGEDNRLLNKDVQNIDNNKNEDIVNNKSVDAVNNSKKKDTVCNAKKEDVVNDSKKGNRKGIAINESIIEKDNIKKENVNNTVKVKDEKKQEKVEKGKPIIRKSEENKFFTEEEKKAANDILDKQTKGITQEEKDALSKYINTIIGSETLYGAGTGISKTRFYKLLDGLGLPRRGKSKRSK